MICFDLPIRTVSGLNVREHYMARSRRVKKERSTAALLTPATLKDSLPLMIRLVRIGPRLLDDDAVPGACKGIRDGIADKLGIKDNDPRVHWYYGQQRGKPREYAVRVEAVPKAVTV